MIVNHPRNLNTDTIVMSDATVEDCKFLILRAFQSQVSRHDAAVLLDRLAGTPFLNDPDVLCHALSCDLDPQRFMGSPLLQDRTFVVRAFKATAPVRQAKELWALLDEDSRQDTRVAFAALPQGFPFSKLPVTMERTVDATRPCILPLRQTFQ